MAVVEVVRSFVVIGGLGGELATNGRDVGEAAFAGSLVEPELDGLLGDRQQRELLGVGVVGRTLGHSAIIARGCDTVTG
jgi:hypothetical protein